ncbi:hypothetical protein ABBQ38_003468 [Trebouxia sp. C0009 RCD-2024]
MGKQTEGHAQKALDSPCANLYQASLKCLELNKYNADKCQDAFIAYKDCKKQEVATRLERRQEAQRSKKGWF